MKFLKWASLVAALVSVLVPARAVADDVRVRGTVANVRAEGSTRAAVLFQVKAGETLHVLATAGDWLHVETADGRKGWVSKTVVAVEAAPAGASEQPRKPVAGSVTSEIAGGIPLQIEHKEVACIVGDRYPRLDACFQPAGTLGNAKVLFRAGDSGPWYAVDLMPEGNCHVAYLPKPLATTTEIQYFVDAVDKSFNPYQQPETAPETAYRARVVRNQGDCEAMKRVAASVKKIAKPIVVAAGRTKGGAPAVLGAILVGFSQEGVVLATAAAAAGVGAAGATAATAGAAGSGGGIGTGTLAVAGGVVAAGALVAVAASGGGEEEQACNAADVVAASQGSLVLVDAHTVCISTPLACPRGGSLQTCVGGLCTSSCAAYYQVGGQRFTCSNLPSCFGTTGTGQLDDPTLCLAAAQQALSACQ
jgi:hypothetical protein